MRISDWSSGVCSSDLLVGPIAAHDNPGERRAHLPRHEAGRADNRGCRCLKIVIVEDDRRRFPTEFEREARDPIATDRGDLATRHRRSGEADLVYAGMAHQHFRDRAIRRDHVDHAWGEADGLRNFGHDISRTWRFRRSEEHTSELQSLMRISYAVFCLK